MVATAVAIRIGLHACMHARSFTANLAIASYIATVGRHNAMQFDSRKWVAGLTS